LFGMRHLRRQAVLLLDGREIGLVVVYEESPAWAFGKFMPMDEYDRFSLMFGRWSLFLHEDDTDGHLSSLVRGELREIEREIDQHRAELRWLDTGERKPIRQVNIDGALIEWRP